MKRLCALFVTLSIVLDFSMFFADTPSYAMDVYPDTRTYTIHDAYVYPITSDSAEWFATDSHADRVAYCQIPDDILCNMDTMALVQTISEYPLLIDVLVFNTAEDAYETIYYNFNAIRELETRADAFDVLAYVTGNDYPEELDWITETALKTIMLSGPFTADTNQTDADIDYSSVYKFYPELKVWK